MYDSSESFRPQNEDEKWLNGFRYHITSTVLNVTLY